MYDVFQSSYKIEAELIGTDNFPPLSRGINDIRNSKTDFYGYFDDKCLAAVIEIEMNVNNLEINSLTVDPRFFRRGIADKLIAYVLTSIAHDKAIAETAVVNEPAIKLYQKHGFVEFKRWTPSHGIEKLALLMA
ncbi:MULTISPECIES: N-acetyltransferase [unclassified Pseudoalteromonas]|uniref:GNAT family N-acetyltransferase n=1 Tax=unclassified Pseudoalteromonas TaxID=194690 RepID=UPI0005A5D16B|nr:MULTISPECIES: N-acetyltransferase [unclassified Pseudoalteromonas]